MKILVTGGAGYIGSHTVRSLMAAGHSVVVFDNLSSGNAHALPEGVLLIRADLLDLDAVQDTLKTHQPEAVVHFAALIEVGESMAQPGRYYRNNVVGSLNLLTAIANTLKIPVVFSSTAALRRRRSFAHSRGRAQATHQRLRRDQADDRIYDSGV